MGCMASSEEPGNKEPQKQESKQKNRQATQEQKVVIKLKEMRDALRRRKEELYKCVEKSDNQTKQLMKEGKRHQAKFAFNKKVLYESYIDDVLNKEQVIQKTIVEVDTVKLNKQATDVLKMANQCLSDIQGTMEEDLQEGIDEMRENMEKQERIQQLLGEYGQRDEEEMEREYNQYEAETLQSSGINNIPQLDSKYQNPPQKVQEQQQPNYAHQEPQKQSSQNQFEEQNLQEEMEAL